MINCVFEAPSGLRTWMGVGSEEALEEILKHRPKGTRVISEKDATAADCVAMCKEVSKAVLINSLNAGIGNDGSGHLERSVRAEDIRTL